MCTLAFELAAWRLASVHQSLADIAAAAAALRWDANTPTHCHKKMRISLPAVLAFLCGFAATVVVVQHRVPALGALHLDGTHSPHHLRAKPQPPALAAVAPRAPVC